MQAVRAEEAAAAAEAAEAAAGGEGGEMASEDAAAGTGAGGSGGSASVGAPAASHPRPSAIKYTSIDRFAFSQSDKFVTVHIDLPGVKGSGATCDCKFTSETFTLTVDGYMGSNLKLVQGPLFKEINPKKSKVVVKADKVKVMLSKVETQFSEWSQLKAKNGKTKKKKADPSGDLMEMMKDLYDEGDDTMKRTIGEAMMKSRQGKGAGGMPM